MKTNTHLPEDYRRRLTDAARNGLSLRETAETLAMTESALKKQLTRTPEAQEALSLGRETPNAQVEQALYKRATGYTVTVRKNVKCRRVEYDPATGKKVSESDEMVPCEDEIYIPPDIAAQRLWLTNCAPDAWSDRREIAAQVQQEPAPAPTLADRESALRSLAQMGAQLWGDDEDDA